MLARPARVDRVVARRGDVELEARRVRLRRRRRGQIAAEVALAPGAALLPGLGGLEAARRAVVDDLAVAGPARGRGGDGRRRQLPEVGADEREVVVPVPARARIGVVVGAAVARAVGIGDLVVADDVRAVDGDRVLGGELGDQLRRGAVHRVGVPGAVADVALVLDADRGPVVGAVARVPGDVLLVDHLGDRAVGGADDEVGGAAGARVLEPAHRARVGALGLVDHDPGDGRVVRPVGGVVDRRAGGDPDRAGLLAGRRRLARARAGDQRGEDRVGLGAAGDASQRAAPAGERGRALSVRRGGEQDGAGVEVGAQVAADRAARAVRERGGAADLRGREVHRAPAAVERRAGRHAAVRVGPADRLEQPRRDAVAGGRGAVLRGARDGGVRRRREGDRERDRHQSHDHPAPTHATDFNRAAAERLRCLLHHPLSSAGGSGWLSSARSPSSSSTATPSCSARASFEPGDSPATT